MKRIILIIGGAVLLVAVVFVAVPKWERHREIQKAEELLGRELPPVIEPNSSSSPASPARAEVNLKVPFTSQAPTGNWDLPYQEACEEASALMAIRYVFANPITDPADAEA